MTKQPTVGKNLVPDLLPASSLQTATHQFGELLGNSLQFIELFEHMADVYFFMKDRESRMVAASQPFIERLGGKTAADLLGKTDYDFFPRHAADHFVADDQQVMRTGVPLIGRVELWYNSQRILDWFVTNKLPVRGKDGEVIGVMGTVRSYEGRRRLMLPMSDITDTVDYLRNHLFERLSVTDIAQRAGLSERQLHRRFVAVFGVSVQGFIMKSRIQAASQLLLESTLEIGQIAIDCGFCDQSAFTVQFRRHTGLTPKKFRARYCNDPAGVRTLDDGQGLPGSRDK
jgi:AraC-like DNA-binding protein